MSKAYENAQNNDRPRGAAQWRKYRAECERGREVIKQIIAEENKPLCICLEHIGDNGVCPVHGAGLEGSDTSMNAQLNEAGFGPGGVL